MEPIDRQALTTVTGGFAFLAALPGILSGVTGLVNAFKGSGSSPQPAQPQPPAAVPTAAAPTGTGAPSGPSMPTQAASGGSPTSSGFDPMSMLSSVTNIIRIG